MVGDKVRIKISLFVGDNVIYWIEIDFEVFNEYGLEISNCLGYLKEVDIGMFGFG